MQENGICLTQQLGMNPDDLDPAYWMGHVFAWWVQMYDENGYDIAKNVDLQWLYNCYETLHTTSLDYTINFIKEEMEFEKEQ